MAGTNEIHIDDIGTEFILTITEKISGVDTSVDISSATLKEIIFVKSDKTKLSKTAEFTVVASGGAGDGTDGKISYYSVLGDLDIKGGYKIQAIVTTPLGKWYSNINTFSVYANL